MLLKAAINGKRSRKEHPAIPINPSQQAHQAAIAVEAGAGQDRMETARTTTAIWWRQRGKLLAVRARCPES